MSDNVKKTRNRLIQEVKDCGQDLIDRAEEFVGAVDVMTDFDIILHFSVNEESIPVIVVSKEYYPKTTLDRFVKGEE